VSTVLSEMGALWRAIPRVSAGTEEIALWYERKARLFERIAGEAGATAADAARADAVANGAREHARRLKPCQEQTDPLTRGSDGHTAASGDCAWARL
jgi:hypothetical protein